MKERIKKLYSDKITGWSFNISAFLWLACVLSILIAYRNLPPFLPLYNNMSWGYTRLGNTYEIFFPLGLTLICILLNTYLGLSFKERMPLLTRFLFITTLSISIFTTIFVVKLLLVIL